MRNSYDLYRFSYGVFKVEFIVFKLAFLGFSLYGLYKFAEREIGFTPPVHSSPAITSTESPPAAASPSTP